MKKIFTLLMISGLGTVAFGQTIFQSNLSSWSAGDPSDWMGTARTNIASSKVVEQTIGATYGTSFASLINTGSTHKRFATAAIPVTGGETYEIKIWLACTGSGEIRTGWYDATNSNYNSAYNPYIDAATTSAGNLVMIDQLVTLPLSCNSAEFILSIKNTDVNLAAFDVGILIDSVAISVATATSVDHSLNKKSNIHIFPNPTSDQLNVEMETKNVTVKIYNSAGEQLKTIKTLNSNISIDVSPFPEGIYFYDIIDAHGNSIATDKFLITK